MSSENPDWELCRILGLSEAHSVLKPDNTEFTLVKYSLSNLLNAECVLHLYWLEFTKYVPFVGFGFV